MTNPEMKLSFYVLTCNSDKYLSQILGTVRDVVDEIIIVNSGETSRVEEIACRYNARVLFRKFDNFVSQRNFAIENCKHQWVLSLDSDEVPDDQFATSLQALKESNYKEGAREFDAFRIKREWYAMGKKVRVLYPVASPDYPVRLFRKDRVGYTSESSLVHESPSGFTEAGFVGGTVSHYTFESLAEINDKLEKYTSLAAQSQKFKLMQISWTTGIGHALGNFIKYYLLKGGWRDGFTGYRLGKYAFSYVYLKYSKARIQKNLSKNNVRGKNEDLSHCPDL